ncbi:MAG: C39 family peptidase [Candidatus Sericytochromatia bacterium]
MKKIGQLLKNLGIIDSKTIKSTLELQKQEKKLFGQILEEKNIVKKSFLDEIVHAISGNTEACFKLANKKIGEILVALNFIEQDKIESSLSQNKKEKLGTYLLKNNFINLFQLNKALKIQKKLATVLILSSTTLIMAQGCTPRVNNLEANIGVVQDYSSSYVDKVITDRVGTTVNHHQDGTISISNVPYFRQGKDNTCAQAVMTSVLNFWGVPVSYQAVINQTNSINTFTDVSRITSYLRKNGLYAQDYKKADLNFIKDRINKGNPVIILLDFGKLSYEHYVLVTGYNDKAEELLILDPIDGPNQKYTYDQITHMWQNSSLKKMNLFGDKYSNIAFDVYNPSNPTVNSNPISVPVNNQSGFDLRGNY